MLNVLIVEDNVAFRSILKRILSSHFPGMHIEEAGDGETALLKIKDHPPELIFMDIVLPGKSGLETTEGLKRLYPDIWVVMITTYDTLEYRKAASEAGAEYFISKQSNSATEIIDLVRTINSKTTVH